jgi:hypothetical protein
MNLNDLKALGVFVEGPPVPRDVTVQPRDRETGEPKGKPQTLTVFIKRPSAGWLDRARMDAARSKDGISHRSAYIAHAIIFRDPEKGDQQMPYDEAYLLHDDFSEALYQAYLDVNQPPPPPASAEDAEVDFTKNSEPTHGSGTNSSEPASAAAP